MENYIDLKRESIALGKYSREAGVGLSNTVSNEPVPTTLKKGNFYTQIPLPIHLHENLDTTGGGYWDASSQDDLGFLFEEVHPDLIDKAYTIYGTLKLMLHNDALAQDTSVPITLRTYKPTDETETAFHYNKSIDCDYTWDASTKTATLTLPVEGFHVAADEWIGIFKAGATMSNYLSVYYNWDGVDPRGIFHHLPMTGNDTSPVDSDEGSWIGCAFDYALDGESNVLFYTGDENDNPVLINDPQAGSGTFLGVVDYSYQNMAWEPTNVAEGATSVTFDAVAHIVKHGVFTSGAWAYTDVPVSYGDYYFCNDTLNSANDFLSKKTIVVWIGAPNYFVTWTVQDFLRLDAQEGQPLNMLKTIIEANGFFVMPKAISSWNFVNLGGFDFTQLANDRYELKTTDLASLIGIDREAQDMYIDNLGVTNVGRYYLIRSGILIHGNDFDFPVSRNLTIDSNGYADIDDATFAYISEYIRFTRPRYTIDGFYDILNTVNSLVMNGLALAERRNNAQDLTISQKIDTVKYLGHTAPVLHGEVELPVAHDSVSKINENFVGSWKDLDELNIHANPNAFGDETDNKFAFNTASGKVAKIVDGSNVTIPFADVQPKLQEAFTGTMFTRINFPSSLPAMEMPAKDLVFIIAQWEYEDSGSNNLWSIALRTADETLELTVMINDFMSGQEYTLYAGGVWTPQAHANINGDGFAVTSDGQISFSSFDGAAKKSAMLAARITHWEDVVSAISVSSGTSGKSWNDTEYNIGTPPYTRYVGATESSPGIITGVELTELKTDSKIMVDWIVTPADVGVLLGDQNYFSFDGSNTSFEPGDNFDWEYSDGDLSSINLTNGTLIVYLNSIGAGFHLVDNNVVNLDLLTNMRFNIPGGDGGKVAGVYGVFPVGKGLHYQVKYNLPVLYQMTGDTKDIAGGLPKTTIVDAINALATQLAALQAQVNAL